MTKSKYCQNIKVQITGEYPQINKIFFIQSTPLASTSLISYVHAFPWSLLAYITGISTCLCIGYFSWSRDYIFLFRLCWDLILITSLKVLRVVNYILQVLAFREGHYLTSRQEKGSFLASRRRYPCWLLIFTGIVCSIFSGSFNRMFPSQAYDLFILTSVWLLHKRLFEVAY